MKKIFEKSYVRQPCIHNSKEDKLQTEAQNSNGKVHDRDQEGFLSDLYVLPCKVFLCDNYSWLQGKNLILLQITVK